MTKRHALIIVGMLVAMFWPWLGNPFGYVHWRDRIRTSIPVAVILGDPCTTEKDGIIEYDFTPNCIRYDAPREFTGIWLYEFEGSTFLENAREIPAKRPPYRDTAWLDYDPSKIEPAADYNGSDKDRNCYPIHAFKIRFIGQRNPNGGGHLGLWNSEIVVEHMLSAEPLGALNCETYNSDS
jgi:hypothetical protein